MVVLRRFWEIYAKILLANTRCSPCWRRDRQDSLAGCPLRSMSSGPLVVWTQSMKQTNESTISFLLVLGISMESYHKQNLSLHQHEWMQLREKKVCCRKALCNDIPIQSMVAAWTHSISDLLICCPIVLCKKNNWKDFGCRTIESSGLWQQSHADLERCDCPVRIRRGIIVK